MSIFNNKKLEKELKKEFKVLNKLAKKIVEKRILKKIKSVEDLDEKLEVLKYSIKSALDIIVHNLEKKMKESKKDVFFAETKLSMLKMKTKLFNVTHNKQDFNTVFVLIKEVEKEVKNV